MTTITPFLSREQAIRRLDEARRQYLAAVQNAGVSGALDADGVEHEIISVGSVVSQLARVHAP